MGNINVFFLEQIQKTNKNGFTQIEIKEPDYFKDLVDLEYFKQIGFKVNILSDKILIDWSNWENTNKEK